MPWHVQQGGGSCGSTEWAVIKDSDGSTAGCHKTKSDAEAQMAALYANEPSMNGILVPQEVRQRRAAIVAEQPTAIPAGAARSLGFPSTFQVRMVERDGKQLYHLHGTATAYERTYEMWDAVGPYKEGVRRSAGATSLAKPPDVAFLVNHKGITMARTTNGTLELAEFDTGLDYDAFMNPQRQDVRDTVLAVEDGSLTESSFAFMITRGSWNDDFTEYWIEEYDIDRGDVSVVNYGANPYTSVAARSRELLADLDHAHAGLARAALQRLQGRPDLAEAQPSGRSVALELQLLRLDES